jgi:hypothetical protein
VVGVKDISEITKGPDALGPEIYKLRKVINEVINDYASSSKLPENGRTDPKYWK